MSQHRGLSHASELQPTLSQPVAEDTANLTRRRIADRLRVNVNQVTENWREGLGSEEEEDTVKRYEQEAAFKTAQFFLK